MLALLLLALLVLTACGPERSASKPDNLEEETVRIAQAFAQDGDLDRARISLQALEVANPMQWLVYQAETAISEGRDANETQALAELAIGLGSQSHFILDFGVRAGLVTATPEAGTMDTAAQAAPAAVDQTPPSSAPTVAVIAMEPTENAAQNAGESAALPTSTPQAAAEEPTPEPTAIPIPQAVASTSMNVRSGPGTAYPIVDDMGSGEAAEIVAKNAQSDWWQVKLAGDQVGWVFGQLVTTSGDVGSVAVASDIPEPPTPTPAPVVAAPPPEAPQEEAPPEEEAPPPAADGPDYRVIEKRLWDVYENGGSLSGPTVICGEKHELIVNVVDANGNRINGVTVQSDFNASETFVTGAQGKGDGVVEFVLWSGQDVKIVRDADGRDVTSEVARGMTTRTPDIPFEHLIAGQYCTDDESCKRFATPSDQAPGCWGHFSWTVTFQRSY